jgi:mono/diheme cytochrome c family protein
MIMALISCGGAALPVSPNVITPPETTTSPRPGPGSVPALSPALAVLTAGQLAVSGRTIFAGRCAVCHGAGGQGNTAPALIGGNASLAKYGTAGGLYRYINVAMPRNNPGSLSAQDYLDITSFILVESNRLKGEAAIFREGLDNIQLQ